MNSKKVILCVLPFLILAAGAAYLSIRWEDIPPRFPIHWDASGQPNNWATRSVPGVFGMLLIGALQSAFLIVLALVADKTVKPQSAFRSAGVYGLFVLASVLASIMTLSSVWLPFRQSDTLPLGMMAIVAVCLAVALLLQVALMWRAARGTAQAKPSDERLWKWGIFYYNIEDPNLWVPKRKGIGWTLNMARPASQWVVIGFILFMVLNVVMVLLIASAMNS